MLNEQQMAMRSRGIGGSDVAAILGISPWVTPLQLYMTKRGEIEPQATNKSMHWGNILETPILEEYSRVTGNKVEAVADTILHPEHNFMLANIDGRVNDDLIVEIKTASRSDGWGAEGTDEVPDYYLTQVHHYMTVTGAKQCDVAVLIGGNDFRMYHVYADAEMSQMLIDAETKFWKMVQDGVPPDIQTTEDWQLKYFHKLRDVSLEATEQIQEACTLLFNTNSQIKSLEERKKKLTTQVMQYMQDNKQLTIGGQKVGTIIQKSLTGWDFEALKADESVKAKYLNKTSNSAYFQLSTSKNLPTILGV
ncbi:MAG: hypothetical protein EKK64_05335 [Neisseriaceae bacterium]|nr:MAG: hypothetical protein EKK64_05335 [Neisseriaceae bacterium]